MQNVEIRPEFKALIPPLTAEEYAQLERNILAEGCRDPLVVWEPEEWCGCSPLWPDEDKGGDKICLRGGHVFLPENILLDGHNRYEICKKHEIPFETIGVVLSSRQSAIDWIINNQLGRRNLTPEQASFLRGKRYNREKKQGERTDLTSAHFEQKFDTAELLAEEYKVSRATIVRDGQFAEAVDTLAANVGEGVKQQILTRDAPLMKEAIEFQPGCIRLLLFSADISSSLHAITVGTAKPTDHSAWTVSLQCP